MSRSSRRRATRRPSHRHERRRSRRRAGLLGSVSRRAGALADGARPALSRPRRRLSRHRDPRRLRRPAGRQYARTARLPGSRARSRMPRRPPIPAMCISALPSTTPTASGEHAVACGARPVSPDGPVAIDGGPEQGRQGSLSAHPRRHHARTLPAPRRRSSPHDQAHQLHPPQARHERGGVLRALDRAACRHRAADAGRARPALRQGAKLESPRSALGRRRRIVVRQRRGRADGLRDRALRVDADRGPQEVHRRGAILLRRGEDGRHAAAGTR